MESVPIAIKHGYRPIPSSSSENHIVENYDVFDFKLDKSDIEKIDSLECGNRVRFNPNTRFTFRQKMRFLICRIKNFFKNKEILLDIKSVLKYLQPPN